MMKKNIFAVIVFLVFISNNAYSFDVFGFASGTTRDQVEKTIRSLPKIYTNTILSDDEIVSHYKFVETEKPQLIHFKFCKNRLSMVSRSVDDSSFGNFVNIIDEKNKLYGKLDTFLTGMPSVENIAKSHSITIGWGDKEEKIRVSYSSGDSSSIIIVYKTLNSCF